MLKLTKIKVCDGWTDGPTDQLCISIFFCEASEIKSGETHFYLLLHHVLSTILLDGSEICFNRYLLIFS